MVCKHQPRVMRSKMILVYTCGLEWYETLGNLDVEFAKYNGVFSCVFLSFVNVGL